MEERHQRTIRISTIDEDGTFQGTLATEGEASDGDILNIAGGHVADRLPMLLSHWNDPTAIAGSLTDPIKKLKDTPPSLQMTGHIELGGQGALAEVRRDVAYMMKRHGGQLSVRWDAIPGKPPVRRINLPSDHPYHVDAETATGPERWGLYWEEWRALEGSIVALGADPLATVHAYRSRADETEGEVQAFWQRMAKEAEPEKQPEFEPLKPPEPKIELDQPSWPLMGGTYTDAAGNTISLRVQTTTAEEQETPSPEERAAALVASLRTDAIACLEAGISVEELVEAVTDSQRKPDEPVQIVEALAGIATKLEALEARLSEWESTEALEVGQEQDDSPTSTEEENGREEPGDPPAPNPHDVIDMIISGLREAHEPREISKGSRVVTPSEVVSLFEKFFDEARERLREKQRAAEREARGEVQK